MAIEIKFKSGALMSASQIDYYTYEILKRHYLSGATEKHLKREFPILKPDFIKCVLYEIIKDKTISDRYLELNRIKFERKFKEERSK